MTPYNTDISEATNLLRDCLWFDGPCKGDVMLLPRDTDWTRASRVWNICDTARLNR